MSLIQEFLKSFRTDDTLEPGLFQKADGTVWLRNPDMSETQLPGGGGYTPPITFEIVECGPTAVPDTTPVPLAQAHQAGAVLLDYTDPAAPTVLAAGIYSMSGDCACVDAVAAKFASLAVGPFASPGGYDNVVGWSLAGSVAMDPPSVFAPFIGYLQAGQALTVAVQQDDIASHDFVSTYLLQRIT